jgi:hypothetical protein
MTLADQRVVSIRNSSPVYHAQVPQSNSVVFHVMNGYRSGPLRLVGAALRL